MNKTLALLVTILSLGCGQNGKVMTSLPQGQSNSNQVKLTWNSNRGEQDGFYIEESSDGINFAQILTVPDGTQTASVLLPKPGKYYFRIRGYNQAGTSAYTQIQSNSVTGQP